MNIFLTLFISLCSFAFGGAIIYVVTDKNKIKIEDLEDLSRELGIPEDYTEAQILLSKRTDEELDKIKKKVDEICYRSSHPPEFNKGDKIREFIVSSEAKFDVTEYSRSRWVYSCFNVKTFENHEGYTEGVLLQYQREDKLPNKNKI